MTPLRSRGLMLSKGLVARDRFLLVLLGTGLVAVGGAYAADRAGLVDVQANLVLADAATGPDQAWWPWALGAAAVVLVVVGVRSLVAHLAVGRQGPVRLDGSGPSGRLYGDLGEVARTAGDRIAAIPGVVDATGDAVDERGRAVVVLTVSAARDSSPAGLRPALDSVLVELAVVVGPDVPVRVELGVARHRETVSVARVS